MGCASASKNYVEKLEPVDQETLDFLSKVPLFKQFRDEELDALARACVTWNCNAGDTVIKQGDIGHEFFVIVKGTAIVTQRASASGEPKRVAALKSGDYFGEKALLHNEPRSATITAETALSTLTISQEVFREKGLINKVHFAHRKAIGGVRDRLDGSVRGETAQPKTEKTDEQKAFITQALKDNGNLQAFCPLDETQLEGMVDICWKEDVQAGTKLIVEGDIDADFFYVVETGKFHIHKNPTQDEDDMTRMRTLQRSDSIAYTGRGGSFGEMALFFLAPRSASVDAVEDSKVWVFDRYNFKRILMRVADEKIEEWVKHISKVKILESLLEDEKRAVAQALVEIHYSKGEIVMEEGQYGNCFYILFEGELSVTEGGREVNRISSSRKNKTVATFGEKALLDNEKRTATLTVVSASARMLAMEKESFEALLGPLEEIIRQSAQEGYGRTSLLSSAGASAQMSMRRSANPGYPSEASSKERKVVMEDLRKIGLLGCGGFGFVDLYEHKTSKQTYALKGLSKGYIVKARMKKSAINEKNILLMVDSPFVIRLYQTFNAKEMLYFLLEPAMGGELYAIYLKKGFHGSEGHAKFYSAAVLCAFEHLHLKHIIYRDLKPENIMLTSTGHTKLTDMGLAKHVVGMTYTTCGTPDYFAPELVKSMGYTNAIDWWSLGILMFELMSGYAPFEAPSIPQTYARITKGINDVKLPKKVSGPVGILVKGLLANDPAERLPMRPGGTSNVCNDKWYERFDWKTFRDLGMAPPYKPSVKGPKDISNFDASAEDMPQILPYVDDGSGWDKEF